MFMQPLPRVVWQARTYLHAHGSRTWQQSCSHVYTAILLWALGSGLAKTRVFTINPRSGRFFRNLFIIIYHSPHCFVREGWGGGDVSMFLAFAFLPMLCYARRLFSLVLAHIFSFTCTQHMEDVTLADLPLRLHTCRMLRYSRSSSALARMQDVTVADLLLHLHTCGMLHQQIFSVTCGHMLGSCASRSSPALAHMRVAMLADLLLHLHRSHARKLRC